MLFTVGATSKSADVKIQDDAGLPVTGLVAATFPTLVYSRAGANADVAFPALSDLAALTTAWAAGGVKERGHGFYRVDYPNAMFTVAGDVRVRGGSTGKWVHAEIVEVGKLLPITVTPVSSETASRIESTTIEAYYAEDGWTIGPVVVTDSDGEPVDLSTYDGNLVFVAETRDGVDVFTSESVTISGADDNQWSVVGSSDITDTAPRDLQWALRAIDTGLNVVLGRGVLRVILVASQDVE